MRHYETKSYRTPSFCWRAPHQCSMFSIKVGLPENGLSIVTRSGSMGPSFGWSLVFYLHRPIFALLHMDVFSVHHTIDTVPKYSKFTSKRFLSNTIHLFPFITRVRRSHPWHIESDPGSNVGRDVKIYSKTPLFITHHHRISVILLRFPCDRLIYYEWAPNKPTRTRALIMNNLLCGTEKMRDILCLDAIYQGLHVMLDILGGGRHSVWAVEPRDHAREFEIRRTLASIFVFFLGFSVR